MKKIIALLSASMLIASLSFSQYLSNIPVGSQAPELVGKNPDGKELKLSEINKGRYVLIDFWASWCRPCRVANPELVKTFEQYKSKKFKHAKKELAIVSVSLDMDARSWEMAIDKDKLDWDYHMSDLKGWDSDLAAAYNISAIPQIVLLGPDGKVIGVYMESKEAFKALDAFVKK